MKESPVSSMNIGRKRKRSIRFGEEVDDCGMASEMRGMDMNMNMDVDV
jgi:hypothetical protein